MTKWMFDRVVAFSGLVMLLPIMALIAAGIKASSPGHPVFFRQIRIGQHGKRFSILKFRTMKGEDTDHSVSVKNDERITSLGHFLRKYKLDELPELWNVLVGDMSFVGPRPDVPGYADRLQGDNQKILELKPGITGPATLKYRNEEELLAGQSNPVEYNDKIIWPDKIKINRKYLDERTFLGDLKIILQTILGS